MAYNRNLVPSASWKAKVYHQPDSDMIDRTWWKRFQKIIFSRDENKCQACNIKVGLSMHHIIPRSEGGRDEPFNMITLCQHCHNEVESLGFKSRDEIIEFKKNTKRKYIRKTPAQKNPKHPIRWQQWVYGGYNTP